MINVTVHPEKIDIVKHYCNYSCIDYSFQSNIHWLRLINLKEHKSLNVLINSNIQYNFIGMVLCEFVIFDVFYKMDDSDSYYGHKLASRAGA